MGTSPVVRRAWCRRSYKFCPKELKISIAMIHCFSIFRPFKNISPGSRLATRQYLAWLRVLPWRCVNTNFWLKLLASPEVHIRGKTVYSLEKNLYAYGCHTATSRHLVAFLLGSDFKRFIPSAMVTKLLLFVFGD